MKHRINLALSLINHQEPTEQVLAEVEAALRGATVDDIQRMRRAAVEVALLRKEVKKSGQNSRSKT